MEKKKEEKGENFYHKKNSSSIGFYCFVLSSFPIVQFFFVVQRKIEF